MGRTDRDALLAPTDAARRAGRVRERSSADELMTQVRAITSSGQEVMRDMRGALDDVRTAAKETENVISTIASIARETRMLAINARIEAANAGDAGHGFNAVAEQVGMLAQRSGEATVDTQDLLGQSQQQVIEGVAAGDEISSVLERIEAALSTSSEAILHKSRIESFVQLLKSDLVFLAATPPVLGICRAIPAGGVDPEDGSPLAVWQKRLAAIFRGFLDSKSHYRSIVFVDAAGEEFVAASRTKAGVGVRCRDVPMDGSYSLLSQPIAGAGVQIGAFVPPSTDAGAVLELSIEVVVSGRCVGVVRADVEADAFLAEMYEVDHGFEFRLARRDGTYIVHPCEHRRWGGGSVANEFAKDGAQVVSGCSGLIDIAEIGTCAYLTIELDTADPWDWLLMVSISGCAVAPTDPATPSPTPGMRSPAPVRSTGSR